MQEKTAEQIKSLILSKEASYVAIAIASIIALAIFVHAIKKWWNKNNIPEYNLIDYDEKTFESIAEDSKNLKTDKKYLFLNRQDKDRLHSKFLDLVNQKVKENKSGLSTTETNCLIAGPAGNGKTSFVRAVVSHLKAKGENAKIMSINTESLAREDGKFFKITPEQKLRNAIKKAREIAGKGKYIIFNIEEMDYVLANPGISKVILDELSSTDNSVNHHIIFVGTTNDPNKIKNIREQQELEDKNKKNQQQNGIFGQMFGNLPDSGDKKEEKKDPKLQLQKAGSIFRRLPIIYINSPNQECIKEMLKFGIHPKAKEREDLIDKLVKVLDGNNAHSVQNVIIAVNSAIARDKKEDEIIKIVNKLVEEDQKQTPLELTKSLIRSSIFNIFSRQDALNDIDRHKLQIDELEDIFKSEVKINDLLTLYREIAGEYKTSVKNLTLESEKLYLEIDDLEGVGHDPYYNNRYDREKHYGIQGLKAKLLAANTTKRNNDDYNKEEIIDELAQKKADKKLKQSEKAKTNEKLKRQELKLNTLEEMIDILEGLTELCKKENKRVNTTMDSASATNNENQNHRHN